MIEHFVTRGRALAVLLLLLTLLPDSQAKKCDRQLQGPGGCRGPNWDEGSWPVFAGERTLEECCQACHKNPRCTAFHVGRAKHDRFPCYLFGHRDLQTVTGLGGECYRIDRDDDDEEPTVEQCKKYIKACPKQDKGLKAPKVDAKPQKEGKEKERKKDEGEDRKREEDKRKKEDDEEKKKREEGKKKEEEERKKKEEEAKKKKEAEQKKKEKEEKEREEKKKKEEEETKKKKEQEEKKKKEEEDKKKAEQQQKKKEKEEKEKAVEEKKKKEQEEQKKKKEKEAAPAADKSKKVEEKKEKPAEKKEKEVKKEKVEEKKEEKIERTKRDAKTEDAGKGAKKSSDKKEKPKKKGEQINFDGKFLLKLGDGGCRGPDWNRKGCPKFIGRKTKAECATECRGSEYCSSFHILAPSSADKKFDCLLFGHKEIIVVPALGGECYTFTTQAPKPAVMKKALKEEDEEEFVRPVGPVRAVEVGEGMCRGRGWTFEHWPVVKGLQTLEQCTKACVDTRACTAFDLSEPSGKKAKCHLYGHKDVVPASGVPGTCYTLFGSALAKKLAVLDEDFMEELETDIEEEVEIELKEPAKYDHLGYGMCRGPAWQGGKWPVVKGPQSVQDCANSCKKRPGCVAFDLSPPADEKKRLHCHLYGHKNPQPASGVPGDCYKLDVDPTDEEDEEPDLGGGKDEPPKGHGHGHEHGHGVVDDGSLDRLPDDGPGYELLGAGHCRGPNWQNDFWPKVEGLENLKGCAADCERDPGCVAFDVSPSEKEGKFRCVNYGHDKVIPASGLRGRCYKMIGRKSIPGVAKPGAAAKYVKVGKGACRGPNWQTDDWPKDKDRRTERECYAGCVSTSGCTAFETTNPSKSGKTIECFLFGHKTVQAASGVEGTCFKMATVKPASEKPKLAAVAGMDNTVDLGEGLCRGYNWQDGVEWPKDKGRRSPKECHVACKQTAGCTAFDFSQPDKSGKKVNCFLYGHADVQPATALEGKCFKMTQVKAASGEAHGLQLAPNEVRVGDAAIAKKLDEGACRGSGWQAGMWPVAAGVMTRKACAEVCIRTEGCTAFDVRKVDAGPAHVHRHDVDPNEYECTIYGHKKVEPAGGVPADCYTVTLLDPSQIPKKAPKKVTKPAPAAKLVAKPAGGKKEPKIPVFEPPKVLEDDDVTDEGYLFEPPPPEVRSRKHIETILHLSETPKEAVKQATETTLKELKKVYENSIKPLENIYKYKELSNRHFGDPEIFNKPLVVLMGPWSGGKSSTMNYLLGTEYTKNAFKAGAEPSAGFYFNIAMHGDQEEEISGTELAAEWAFSSLQKFGQEFLKKLKGKKMPNKLLEKATFAEIPGVLETGSARKVDRLYSFNDACQWFIDHADLILLVYDYTKLDIGPETELLLDQLKGRESQVRILLNKADEITAEELLKIQGNLVWNVSPHMSTSLEPPTLYAGSFWSHPYKSGALKDLLKSQEISLLRDIHDAIEKRVENRISTARRFAVRVRNHAKMVDVYLARYNSNRGLFGNKRTTAEDIINHPEKYHIYEGISTMTNISRYDLPDPKVYKTFFGLHPLDEFPSLQSTCTFFKGCPINKLDLAIAYDLPELLTTYKKKLTQPAQPASKK